MIDNQGPWSAAPCAHCNHPRSDHHRYVQARNACYECACGNYRQEVPQ